MQCSQASSRNVQSACALTDLDGVQDEARVSPNYHESTPTLIVMDLHNILFNNGSNCLVRHNTNSTTNGTKQLTYFN